MTTSKIPNRLIHEKSPYLLQHAYNPVKWYPWGEEAFEKAKNENKPIFLSIGYSTCHWCHVMERESFEDQEVADYLNQYFVPIKVDKEERPDVDSIYMTVCQNLTGSGGWPLTIFLLPDQKPFFAGTYFPKRSKYNVPGLMNILEAIEEKWETDREDFIRTGETILNSLEQDNIELATDKENLDEIINKSTLDLINYFDKEYGGFGRAPKFPTPHNLMYLMRLSFHEQNQDIMNMVEKTLDSMYMGGMFDHIGYGFSRYSTDQKWLVPHFEKMLYDNSLLTITYLEAYQITKNVRYKEIAEMTMEYVLRELTSQEGGFFCAQDADSEGVEGKYYVFTPDEILSILGEEDGRYFNEYYSITKGGNFEGKSIPNRLHSNKTEPLETEKISILRGTIYDYRLSRTELHKDDKILTSWNALMITAFAKAYQILREEKYLEVAKRADQFIQNNLTNDKHLFVHYRDGKKTGRGHIDDYAFYIWALISLYEGTFEPDYLKRALDYLDVLIDEFFDKNMGGFYLYAKDGETLIHRPKELYDGAIPSGNSVAAYVLEKLASYTGKKQILEVKEKQMDYLVGHISQYPSGHCFSMMAAILDWYPTKELICILQDSNDSEEVQQLLSQYFLPNVTALVKTQDTTKTLDLITEFTKDYHCKDNKATFYLCENHACRAPFHQLNELEKVLISE